VFGTLYTYRNLLYQLLVTIKVFAQVKQWPKCEQAKIRLANAGPACYKERRGRLPYQYFYHQIFHQWFVGLVTKRSFSLEGRNVTDLFSQSIKPYLIFTSACSLHIVYT
jgi:hypothetical protein